MRLENFAHASVNDILERGSPRSDNCGRLNGSRPTRSCRLLSEVHLAPIIAADIACLRRNLRPRLSEVHLAPIIAAVEGPEETGVVTTGLSEVHLAPIIAALGHSLLPRHNWTSRLERGSPRSDNCGLTSTLPYATIRQAHLSEVHLAPIIAAYAPALREIGYSAELERGSPRSDNCGDKELRALLRITDLSEVHLAPIIAAYQGIKGSGNKTLPLERGSPRSDNCGGESGVPSFVDTDAPLERGSPRSDNCGRDNLGDEHASTQVLERGSPRSDNCGGVGCRFVCGEFALSEVHLAPIIAA